MANDSTEIFLLEISEAFAVLNSLNRKIVQEEVDKRLSNDWSEELIAEPPGPRQPPKIYTDRATSTIAIRDSTPDNVAQPKKVDSGFKIVAQKSRISQMSLSDTKGRPLTYYGVLRSESHDMKTIVASFRSCLACPLNEWIALVSKMKHMADDLVLDPDFECRCLSTFRDQNFGKALYNRSRQTTKPMAIDKCLDLWSKECSARNKQAIKQYWAETGLVICDGSACPSSGKTLVRHMVFTEEGFDFACAKCVKVGTLNGKKIVKASLKFTMSKDDVHNFLKSMPKGPQSVKDQVGEWAEPRKAFALLGVWHLNLPPFKGPHGTKVLAKILPSYKDFLVEA